MIHRLDLHVLLVLVLLSLSSSSVPFSSFCLTLQIFFWMGRSVLPPSFRCLSFLPFKDGLLLDFYILSHYDNGFWSHVVRLFFSWRLFLEFVLADRGKKIIRTYRLYVHASCSEWLTKNRLKHKQDSAECPFCCVDR